MPISFISGAGSARWDGTANSLSFSISSSGNNRLLVVGITRDTGSGSDPTSITYNSVSLTQIDAITASGNTRRVLLYYLVNPSTGSNTLSISMSSNGPLSAYGAIYSGILQTSPLDVSSTGNSNSATITVSQALEWSIAVVSSPDGVSSVTNVSSRYNPGNDSVDYLDSNGVVSSGSFTSTATTGGRVAGIVLASFKKSLETSKPLFFAQY